MSSGDWQRREMHVAELREALREMHQEAWITSRYHWRWAFKGFRMIHGEWVAWGDRL